MTSGSVIVKVDDSRQLSVAAAQVEARGFVVARQLEDVHALQLKPARMSQARAVAELASLPGVRYAEPIARYSVADQPSDPLYSKQSYLQSVSAPAAWDITKGSPDVVVAVVDTGVDVRHPDLLANIWTNPGEIPNNGADDDNDGCVDDVNGCSFVSDSSPGCQNVTNGFVNDDIGHGTFVSGVIAAARNGVGVVGVASGVKIMPVKVLDCYGSGDSVATARGILFAARKGARVINLSLGGLADAQVVRDAIDTAMRDYNALVVAAAGNDGSAQISFPARLPQVLAVGATSPNPDIRASFSNYGAEVDVVAVGQDVASTLSQTLCFVMLPCIGGGPYAQGSGTSFSAPQVSGLAALMISLRPSLTPTQIIDIIKGSATPLPPGTMPGWAGAGRINMLKALRAVQADHPPGDACVVQIVVDGDSFTCTGGPTVRMLQMTAPEGTQCGADWAKAALQNIFLTPGRTVYLQYDTTRRDSAGRTLAVPLWRGSDGTDYNLSIVMVYVGLAKAADVGTNNVQFHDWANASQTWAQTAGWNMWAPGKPFVGGC
jgi:endonuclease YncB( thermonuclease family)